ncbi:hypothetical protein [Intrasporangium chromatireducens]|uniref:hypothetical protein n=1 Tax=Intrasporangium chromatireducens TaxID=1386088 RepID=UPI0012DE9616|nr:hypothetical protein [Intrasporangium chromatireducens]
MTSRADGGPKSDYIRNGRTVHVDHLRDEKKVSPEDFMAGQLANDIYSMVDASEEEFEEALNEAREEGNASRANVVRKIKGKASPQTRDDRAEVFKREGATSFFAALTANLAVNDHDCGKKAGERHARLAGPAVGRPDFFETCPHGRRKLELLGT